MIYFAYLVELDLNIKVCKQNGKDKGNIYAMKVLKKAGLVRNKETKTYDREINLHAKVGI